MNQNNNRNIVETFRKQTDEEFHKIKGCSARDFEQAVYDYVYSYMEEYAPGTEIMEVVLVGSRARGLERDDSDMDFVIEYEGEMKEDEMFNLLNQEGMYLSGIKVDINPIRTEETGILEDYLLNAEEYLFEKKFTLVSEKATKRNKIISDFSSKTYESFKPINGLLATDLEMAVFNAVEDIIKRKDLDVEFTKVLLSGSRARGIEQSGSNLNFVMEYRGGVKELDLYNLLNSHSLKINNMDIPIELEPIREEESGPLEDYLLKQETYLGQKVEEYEQNLYERWQKVVVEQGYPFTLDDSVIIFPAEYDDFFSSDELRTLEKIMKAIMEKNRLLREKFKEIKEPDIKTPKI